MDAILLLMLSNLIISAFFGIIGGRADAAFVSIVKTISTKLGKKDDSFKQNLYKAIWISYLKTLHSIVADCLDKLPNTINTENLASQWLWFRRKNSELHDKYIDLEQAKDFESFLENRSLQEKISLAVLGRISANSANKRLNNLLISYTLQNGEIPECFINGVRNTLLSRLNAYFIVEIKKHKDLEGLFRKSILDDDRLVVKDQTIDLLHLEEATYEAISSSTFLERMNTWDTTLKNIQQIIAKTGDSQKETNLSKDATHGEPNLQPYLDSVVQKYEKWQQRFVDISGRQEMTISYEDLDFHTISSYWTDSKEREESRQKVEYLERSVTEIRQKFTRFIVLGSAGFGKTTALQYLTYLDAKARLSLPDRPTNHPVPVFIELRYFSRDDTLKDLIIHKLGCSREAMDRMLNAGELTIYLDGLNEIIDNHISANARNEISSLIRDYQSTPIVISSRIENYRDAFQLPTFVLSPLSEDQILRFIERNLSNRQKSDTLFAELRSSPSLYQLSTNPLFLRMLIGTFEITKGKIPHNSGKLIQSFILMLIAREEKQNPYFNGAIVKILLSHLAFNTRLYKTVGFKKHKTIELLLEKASQIGVTINIIDVLTQMLMLGILDEPTKDQLSFAHEVFQEYFSAEELVNLDEAGISLLSSLSLEEGWAGPIVMFAGLCEDPNKLKLLNDELAERMKSFSLPPHQRVLAGRLFSQLGDIGNKDEMKPNFPVDMKLCFVPSGPFAMGSILPEPFVDPDELVQHSVDLDYNFFVSQFPITNFQHYIFLLSNAGDKDSHLSRLQEQTFSGYGKIKGTDKEVIEEPYHLGPLFRLSNHPVVGISWYEALEFTRWITRISHDKKLIPPDWEFRLPTEAEWEKVARGGQKIPIKPLTFKLDIAQEIIKEEILESNLQVNPIADRRYPWGNFIDIDFANYDNTNLGTTSAVGCFPKGVSPYGCEEMSGNVWEWTSSLWGPNRGVAEYKYPYDPYDGREYLQANSSIRRVVRGGSFQDPHGHCRCSTRYWSLPNYQGRNLGFRIVLSQATVRK